MPTGLLNLLDLAKRTNNPDAPDLIEAVTTFAPEITQIFGRPIVGTGYMASLRTVLPATGFRSINSGTALTKSEYAEKFIQCFLMDAQMQVDEMLPGKQGLPLATVLTNEAMGVVTSAGITVGSQFYYGKAADANKGFPGLQTQVDSSLVVDAGGTTDNTATSVYAICEGLDATHLLFGDNGKIVMPEDWRLQRVTDANGNYFNAWLNNLASWIGLQVGHPKSVGRIKKLTQDTGKGLTDALLGKLISQFPIRMKPTKIFLTPRSLEQLRASRTATTVNGVPVPKPDNYAGIPLIETDSILNTETLAQ